MRGRVALARFGEAHPLVLVGVGVVLYATGPVMVQGSSVSGPVFSFWRLWIGAAVLGSLAIASARRRGRGGEGPRSGWRWPLIGGACFGLHQLMMFSAVKMTSVVDVALMGALAPVVTALGAWWLFRERPGRRFHLWSLVAIAGGAYLAVGAAAGPTGNPGGMALAAANVVFFAGFFLVSKRSRDEIGVLSFLAGVMVVAATVVTVYGLLAGEAFGSITRTDLVLATAVAAGPGAVGHFVMTWPLRWVPANIPPVMRLAQPAIAGVLALVLLGEPLTWTHLLGGLVVVAGAAGAITSRAGRALREEARRAGQQAAGAGEPDVSDEVTALTAR